MKNKRTIIIPSIHWVAGYIEICQSRFFISIFPNNILMRLRNPLAKATIRGTIPAVPADITDITDMSSVVNNYDLPKLQIALVLTAVAIIPFLLQAIGNTKQFRHSKLLYRIIWLVSFLWNVITVSVPGRFDNQMAKGTMPWRTLFEPAGWAFAIWAVIYFGETILTGYATFVGQPQKSLKYASLFWAAANCFQSLWCLTFRPAFRNALWLPASQLALACISFFGVYQGLSEGIQELGPNFSNQKLVLYLLRFPVSLHTAWLAAATLLNVNGWQSVAGITPSAQIALSFSSAFIGAAAGCLLSYQTNDPCFALVVAWALSAVASKTRERITAEEKSLLTVPDVFKALALTESSLAKLLILQALVIAIRSVVGNSF